MAVGRAARRAERQEKVTAVIGADAAPAALDLLELVELAWHDCYAEITPEDDVIDDILTCSQGDLATMVRVARLAVKDSRDLRMAADLIRSTQQE